MPAADLIWFDLIVIVALIDVWLVLFCSCCRVNATPWWSKLNGTIDRVKFPKPSTSSSFRIATPSRVYSILFHLIPSYSFLFHLIPSYSFLFHLIPFDSFWCFKNPSYFFRTCFWIFQNIAELSWIIFLNLSQSFPDSFPDSFPEFFLNLLLNFSQFSWILRDNIII